jgi:hypothetical protein
VAKLRGRNERSPSVLRARASHNRGSGAHECTARTILTKHLNCRQRALCPLPRWPRRGRAAA